MSALSDDRPRFEQLTPDEAAEAAKTYRRIWGEEPPPPTTPNADQDATSGADQ